MRLRFIQAEMFPLSRESPILALNSFWMELSSEDTHFRISFFLYCWITHLLLTDASHRGHIYFRHPRALQLCPARHRHARHGKATDNDLSFVTCRSRLHGWCKSKYDGAARYSVSDFTLTVTLIGRALILRDCCLGRLRLADVVDGQTVSRALLIPSGANLLDARFAGGPAKAALLICHGIGETVEHWMQCNGCLLAMASPLLYLTTPDTARALDGLHRSSAKQTHGSPSMLLASLCQRLHFPSWESRWEPG